MVHEKSLSQARYALLTLRIASAAPLHQAKRLVAAIASESAHLDTPSDIIEAEVGAIGAFKRLAAHMDDAPGRRQQQWTIANEAAAAWERAASSCNTAVRDYSGPATNIERARQTDL